MLEASPLIGTLVVGIGLAFVFGAIVVWQLASWFLVGGLYGVLAQRPENRGDTARCFGASGAATYLAYARLAFWSLPGYVVVLFVFGKGMSVVSDRAALLPAEAALEASFDEYGFIRRAYMQRRRYDVYDGAPPEEDLELDLEFDPELDTEPGPALNSESDVELEPALDPELDLDE